MTLYISWDNTSSHRAQAGGACNQAKTLWSCLMYTYIHAHKIQYSCHDNISRTVVSDGSDGAQYLCRKMEKENQRAGFECKNKHEEGPRIARTPFCRGGIFCHQQFSKHVCHALRVLGGRFVQCTFPVGRSHFLKASTPGRGYSAASQFRGHSLDSIGRNCTCA